MRPKEQRTSAWSITRAPVWHANLTQHVRQSQMMMKNRFCTPSVVAVILALAWVAAGGIADAANVSVPHWKAGDWWVAEESGWTIAGLQSAPPDPRWSERGPFRWLCIVTRASGTQAVLEVHQTAKTDAQGRAEVWPRTENVFYPKPTYRITIDLGGRSMTKTEELLEPWPHIASLRCLLPNGKDGTRRIGGEEYIESHRTNATDRFEIDSVIFVFRRDEDLLQERKFWGLDWASGKHRPCFEERQEWREGDRWWRSLARYDGKRITSVFIGATEPIFGVEFWREFQKTGWPESRPHVEARLVDQGNMSERRPAFISDAQGAAGPNKTTKAMQAEQAH
ncbi:MAG: hypothetical protein JXQ75_12170 [Phycisphaerae bacterium]|nr:hypothetical protein [Phycisphaerae bacterium]